MPSSSPKINPFWRCLASWIFMTSPHDTWSAAVSLKTRGNQWMSSNKMWLNQTNSVQVNQSHSVVLEIHGLRPWNQSESDTTSHCGGDGHRGAANCRHDSLSSWGLQRKANLAQTLVAHTKQCHCRLAPVTQVDYGKRFLYANVRRWSLAKCQLSLPVYWF